MTVDERFDAKVDRSGGPDACWPWTASRRNGYGQFAVSRAEIVYAHRFALERELGRALAFGEFALHSCDFPACINPAHLRPGTPADNSRDAIERRRLATGERHGSARLTASQVVEIRAAYARGGVSQEKLGERFGVTQTHVGDIVRGERWGSIK